MVYGCRNDSEKQINGLSHCAYICIRGAQGGAKPLCLCPLLLPELLLFTMMRQNQTSLKVPKPQPMLDIVVAFLASCWLRLNCRADAEFIALFFLLQLITIMGKLCQYKWINPKNKEKCNDSPCFCFQVVHQVGISLHLAPFCFAAWQFSPLPIGVPLGRAARSLRCRVWW